MGRGQRTTVVAAGLAVVLVAIGSHGNASAQAAPPAGMPAPSPPPGLRLFTASFGFGSPDGELGRDFGGEPLELSGAGLAFELLVEVPFQERWLLLGGGLTGHFQSLGDYDEMVSGFDFGLGLEVRLGRWLLLYGSAHGWLEMTGDTCPPDYICIDGDGGGGDDGSGRSVGLMTRAGLFVLLPVWTRSRVVVGVVPRYLFASRAAGQLMPRTHGAVQLSVGLAW